VYNNTLASVKKQIQQAENPMPAVVISVAAVCVDNASLLDYLASEVVLAEPELGSTDPHIPIDNNYMHDTFHFGMPRGIGYCEDQCEESDMRDPILTASRQ
jgi:hypothetical protein